MGAFVVFVYFVTLLVPSIAMQRKKYIFFVGWKDIDPKDLEASVFPIQGARKVTNAFEKLFLFFSA